jgi:hypothetical protein
MFESAKNCGSMFVAGLKNDDADLHEQKSTPQNNAAWIVGKSVRVIGIGTVGLACLMGCVWEHRWLNGKTKFYDSDLDKWFDYKSYGEYLSKE